MRQEFVLSQYAEEAGFHWVIRDRAVVAPHYSLADLAAEDAKLEAHLDGLRVGGEPGWKVLEEYLSPESPGEVFAAAVLCLEAKHPERMEQVLALAAKDPLLGRAVGSAFGWVGQERAKSLVEALLGAEEPARQLMALRGLAALRMEVEETVWPQVLACADPLVRARAYRAIGELGKGALTEALQRGLGEEDPACRFWAAWSLALLGQGGGTEGLGAYARQPGTFAQIAVDLLTRLLRPAEVIALHQGLAGSKDEALSRLAVRVAGIAGDPRNIPWLLEQMKAPALARTAGEALSMITGVDLAYEDLEGEQPEGFAAGPTDDPEDENVDLDPNGDLPWPEAALVEAWWAKAGKRYPAGKRFFLGRAFEPRNVQLALQKGKQRQRAAAALELKLRDPRQPLFEVRARGDLQKRALGWS